jgi:plasmid segregation protein ParM
VKAIVRAIDVGYRYTKWVAGVEDGHVHCKCFPSVAPLETRRDLAEALGRKRKTVVIEVDGLRYEVGPDALLAQETSPSQNMDDDFALTPEYLALVRGALRREGRDLHPLIASRSARI